MYQYAFIYIPIHMTAVATERLFLTFDLTFEIHLLRGTNNALSLCKHKRSIRTIKIEEPFLQKVNMIQKDLMQFVK
jgi:hypothetical protein